MDTGATSALPFPAGSINQPGSSQFNLAVILRVSHDIRESLAKRRKPFRRNDGILEKATDIAEHFRVW